MALKIIYENKEATGLKVKVDQRLYLDAQGKLVEEGNAKAVVLYCSAGKHVNKADFEERGGVVKPAKKPEPEAEPKAKPKVTKKKVTKKTRS